MSKTYTTKEKRVRNLKYVAIILASILLVSSALLMVRLWENKQAQFPTQESVTASVNIEHKGVEYRLKDGVEAVLVLGLDKFEGADSDSYNNDKQADFLMLLVADHENKVCSALHINRDTIAEMSILGVAGDKVGTVRKQIALAHTYGNGREVSCRNTADSVSKLLLNVPIDRYVSVKMDAVAVYNDLIGGVEVTVLDDFTGIDDTLVQGETVTLYGEHALNYVRTRYGLDDSTNSRRMVRQRQYIEALYQKTLTVAEGDDSFVVNAAAKLADFLITNYTGNGLQSFAERISDYTFAEISALDGRIVKGEEHMEFYPYESSVKETVINLFYEPVN